MKNTLRFLLKCSFIVGIFLLSNIGCHKDTRECNAHRIYPKEAFITINFEDKRSGAGLIGGVYGIYSRADIKVVDENNKPVDTHLGSDVTILFFAGEKPIPEGEVRSRIFLDLKDDRDTIDFVVKNEPVPCWAKLSYLKVTYNGMLVFDENNITGANFTIKK